MEYRLYAVHATSALKAYWRKIILLAGDDSQVVELFAAGYTGSYVVCWLLKSCRCLLATQQVRLKLICREQYLLAARRIQLRCSIPNPGVRCQARHHSWPVAVIVKRSRHIT